jgi:hypothetical protein
VQHDVVIVVDPDAGVAEGNVAHKPTGTRCRHLRGEPGRCSCAVHDRPWYGETPCFSHGQIERRADDVCRMGEYVLRKRGGGPEAAKE